MVVDLSYEGGLAIQCDWARNNGQAVAAAASLGLITTVTSTGYGRRWRPTTAGMRFLDGGPL